ncbi:MAG: MMPL family transporter [Thermoleophilia bacterium]|nr:MMPL family transporter [Thermoleophilia bacterium]
MTGRLYSLSGFCIRHRRLVVSFWIVLAIGVSLLSSALGKQFADDLTLPGKDSQAATDLVADKFPEQANGSIPVLYKAEKGKITDSANEKTVKSSISELSNDKLITSINSPFTQATAGQISKDGTIAYASMVLRDAPGDLSDEDADHLVDKTHSSAPGIEVAVGGYLGDQVSSPSTESSEAVGLVMAMLVLALTFGTIVAMGLPILTAIFGLTVSTGLLTVFSNFATISTVAPTLATMIGLGVGIDYALFVVTRHRQAMHEGHEPQEAAARAAATAGGAVVFAGTTVILALLSLGLAGIPLVWTLGYSAAVAVAVAMLASVTLLPAILAMVGHGIDRLRIPLPHDTSAAHPSHGWRRWAEGVARHPVAAALFSVLILLVIALPVRNLDLGQEDDSAMPKSTDAHRAYVLTSEGFGVGNNGPLLIAMEVGARNDVMSLEQAIAKTKGIDEVTPATFDKSGDAAIFNAVPTTSPSSFATQDTINLLRDTTIPRALDGTQSAAHVGGSTAGNVDLADEIGDKLPQVIFTVVLLSFLVLVLAFRSIVVPLQAAVMNLLSIGAAYGLVTFVFQEGHGASLIGLEGAVPVVSFLPLVMFAILFGLSMDYEVFLLTQIKEAWHKSGDSDSSVIAGVTTSGRVITSAALIMVAVFFSFVLSGDPVVKQFGVGLAFAVAIDATIVRCMLVPAVMILMKRSNWWFPAWLDRIVPRIDIEGNEYFENRESGR